jgi:hypothetical protein
MNCLHLVAKLLEEIEHGYNHLARGECVECGEIITANIVR